MPLFEFRCRACGDEFELLVRNREPVRCPHCDAGAVDKLMSAPVGHVAGGGLPVVGRDCPPPSAPPCGPGCCRLPMG